MPTTLDLERGDHEQCGLGHTGRPNAGIPADHRRFRLHQAGDMAWEPTQFDGILIKVLYEDKAKGEMTCFPKWEPGATLPMHKHPEIEQTYVIEGSFYDHDGICRAGEFVWRGIGSFDETRSDEGAVILAVYRQLNVFQHGSGYSC